MLLPASHRRVEQQRNVVPCSGEIAGVLAKKTRPGLVRRTFHDDLTKARAVLLLTGVTSSAIHQEYNTQYRKKRTGIEPSIPIRKYENHHRKY